MLNDSQGEVKVSLYFGVDEVGRAFVRGNIAAELSLVCQRCLETLHWPVNIEICLAIVSSEREAGQLDDSYEPLVVGERLTSLSGMVEDEILLALPVVALHPQGTCTTLNDTQTKTGAAAKVVLETKDQNEKPNPFAVLAQLKSTKNQKQ